MILAGIDIGTNTLRLLIVEYKNRNWKELFSSREMTRLGEGFLKENCLASAAIQRTIIALKEFQQRIHQFRCDDTVVVATSAVREALNQKAFLSRVKEELGMNVEVISGEEEARLTYLGTIQAISSPIPYQLMIDIGGGSTEWVLGDQQKILVKKSTPLGVVFLTEEFLVSDPPSSSELIQLKKRVRKHLSGIKEDLNVYLKKNPPVAWIGTAGTITTLAAMAQGLEHYSFDKINRFVLNQETVSGLYQNLISKTKEERKKIKGLEAGREDIIVSGAFILLESMLFFNFNHLIVSDYGLREGIIINKIAQLKS